MPFYLFGQLRIEPAPGEDRTSALPRLRKTQGLLAYLLLFHARAHTRDHLTSLFWGDAPQERARASLSVALNQLRPVLTAAGALLIADHSQVRLKLGAAWLDVAKLEEALATGTDSNIVADALRLYAADLLEGWPDEWCVVERERLRRQVLKVGIGLARGYLSAQQWSDGADLTRRLLVHDPLNEGLHDLHLQLLLGSGDYEAARDHYRQFAALLRDELHIEPSSTTQQLYSEAQRPKTGDARRSYGGSSSRDAVQGASGGGSSSRLPFVGRVAEQSAIREALDALRRGQGGLVLVKGEAGVGKTKLVEEVLAEAGRVRVARGRAYEQGHEIPFAPLLQPLSSWLLEELAPAQVLQRLGPTTTAVLAQIIPVLGARLPGLRPLTPLPPAEAQTRLLQSVVAALLSVSAPGSPVALFLDDLQWSDDHTIRVLEQLRGQVKSLPMLIVCTFRGEELAADSLLARLAGRVEREGAPVLELQPLSLEELHSVVEPRMPPSGAMLSRWLHERSGGNAFYLAELLRGLVEDGKIASDPTVGGWRWTAEPLPDAQALKLPGVRSTILERYARLSRDGQVLCRVATVLGGVESFQLLWQASDLSEEAALVALEESLARRFIVQAGTEDSYSVAHDLVRQAIYESVPTARRTRLHGRVAETLEKLMPEPPAAEDILRLAYHYARSSNIAKQREYFPRAAEAARTTFANDAAIEYYERQLALLPPVSQTAVLRKQASVLQHTGQFARAEAALRRAMQQAEAAGDAQAAALARVALGGLLSAKGAYDEALLWLEQAQAVLVQGEDRSNLADLLEKLGGVHWYRASYSEAIAYFARMLQLAEEMGDRAVAGRAFNLLGRVYTDQGEYPAAVANIQRALQIAVETGDRVEEMMALWAIGYYHFVRKEYRETVLWHGKTLEVASDIGHLRAFEATLSGFGMAYLQHGDYPAAYRIYAHQLALAVEQGNRTGMLIGSEKLATLQAAQGRLAEAEQNWARSIALGRLLRLDYYLAVHCYSSAELLVTLGRPEEALRLAMEAGRSAAKVEHREYELRTSLLQIRLRSILGHLSTETAVEDSRRLMADAREPAEKAEVLYTVWQIDPAQEEARQAAGRAYEQLYMASPHIEYRQRYRELTGQDLPDPAALPPLPASIPLTPHHLDPLFRAVDALIADLTRDSKL